MPPSCFSKIKLLAQHGNHGRGNDLEVLAGFLAGKGKIIFGNPRCFYSIPAAALAELQLVSRTGSTCVARSDANQRRSPSIVGAISRTMSVPSIYGEPYQVCGYHIRQLLDDLVGSSSIPVCIKSINKHATTTSRKALLASSLVNLTLKSGHRSGSTTHGQTLCQDQHTAYSISQRANMTKREASATNIIHGHLSRNVTMGIAVGNSHLFRQFRGFHTSTFASVFAGAATDESLDHLSGDGQGRDSATSEQSIHMDKPLKLLCGSCYLPHPDKEETGGEDAHFICLDKQVLGVADGVGGWADLGVDSGLYSRELMSNAVAALQEEPSSLVDPARVLEKAHAKTKAKGSSTACIIALADQGLHAVNLGDSGFVVIRDGSTVFKSPVQQHDFNFTYQLESGNNGDLPSSGQVFKIPVTPGDVIVAGTDGLFDNLYNNEITGVVIDSVRAGFGPQVAAQKIAALARERALDKNRQTPFATAAQDAGFRYHGGKLDDITVVVSYITKANDGNGSTPHLE